MRGPTRPDDGGDEPPAPGGAAGGWLKLLRAAPWGVAAAGVGWWMTNVAFWTLGATHTDSLGHRAWLAGYRVPNWFRHVFPYAGMAAWIGVVLVIGGYVTVRGRAAWRPVLAVAAVSGLLAAGISALYGWILWPHGF